jgi:hypothetical protein
MNPNQDLTALFAQNRFGQAQHDAMQLHDGGVRTLAAPSGAMTYTSASLGLTS